MYTDIKKSICITYMMQEHILTFIDLCIHIHAYICIHTFMHVSCMNMDINTYIDTYTKHVC